MSCPGSEHPLGLARYLWRFTPLMRGSTESGIMEQWKQMAQTEPNSRRRSDYAGLALVFAELTTASHLWRRALEGWNLRQSMQVLEWQAEARLEGRVEGEIKGKAEALLRLLEKRFHWFDKGVQGTPGRE